MRLLTYRRAGAVVVDGDRVLLVSMQPPGDRRWWFFPGGGIEDGETPEAAAVRELEEETGLRAVHATEYLKAGVHGGEHHYFLMTCDDLELGPVTGPELVYAANADFRAEWVPISALASMPVWPRCVAEHLASSGTGCTDVVPWLQDDRQAGDGLDDATGASLQMTVRAVVVESGRLAAIARELDGDQWHRLPGGGARPGESAANAVVREVREELGVDVLPTARLAVVVVRAGRQAALDHYFSCAVQGGRFGTGDGDEFSAERVARRGTYRPVWLDPASLPATLRPPWLAERLPAWLRDPAPERPERFFESHDD